MPCLVVTHSPCPFLCSIHTFVCLQLDCPPPHPEVVLPNRWCSVLILIRGGMVTTMCAYVLGFPWQVFFRPAMLKDARHVVKDQEGNVTGVRLMCPTCKSNEFTTARKQWAYVSSFTG